MTVSFEFDAIVSPARRKRRKKKPPHVGSPITSRT
jgi:hypothetical protein